MQKTLRQILANTKLSPQNSDHLDFNISGLAFDSRKVEKDFLFFALPGVHVDGNSFIQKAIEKGAKAIVYQGELPQNITPQQYSSVAFIHTDDSRFAMAPVSDAFYDYPSKKLVIFGVTGTEGKSSTVFFTWQLLRLCGYKCGFISTVEYSLGGDALPNPEHQTTPEAPLINEKLYQMIQNGCTHAVIESSSHGLSVKTNRLGSILFDAASFMNVTHEHLEFHGSHEKYKDDKANLFRNLPAHSHRKENGTVTPVGAVNIDDPAANYFAEKAMPVNVVGFSINPNISTKNLPQSPNVNRVLCAKQIEGDETGFNFVIEDCQLAANDGWHIAQSLGCRMNTPGDFNAYNAMAALIMVESLCSRSLKDLAAFLPQIQPVRGRMSKIDAGQPFEVLVDYAHTPSSFNTIFPPLRDRVKGKIISLFGSGGERDTVKRPQQGEIAAKYSDIVILADEDPRGEEPMELLEDIAAGCKNLIRGQSLYLICDRPQAIRKAFSLAKAGDIVLLLGKGHENSIIYKDFTMPYDEIAEAKKALAEMGFSR